MTKSELIKALENWPEDAQVEMAIPVDLDSEEPEAEDKVWFPISFVEEVNTDPKDTNEHCLLFAGKMSMG